MSRARSIGQGLLDWALDLRMRASEERELRVLRRENLVLLAENAGLRLALQRVAPDAARFRQQETAALFAPNGGTQ